jgi:hypothetical protein
MSVIWRVSGCQESHHHDIGRKCPRHHNQDQSYGDVSLLITFSNGYMPLQGITSAISTGNATAQLRGRSSQRQGGVDEGKDDGGGLHCVDENCWQ